MPVGELIPRSLRVPSRERLGKRWRDRWYAAERSEREWDWDCSRGCAVVVVVVVVVVGSCEW